MCASDTFKIVKLEAELAKANETIEFAQHTSGSLDWANIPWQDAAYLYEQSILETCRYINKLDTAENEIERLKGLLATGAGCEEGYRQHYSELLDKCESARIKAEETAKMCEERMLRYGNENKILRDAMGTHADSYRNGIEAAAQLMEIQSPHVFVDPDYLAAQIRALAE